MANLKQDNVINPSNKKVWGFTSDNGVVTVGTQTAEQAGKDVPHIRTSADDKEARKNGGGSRKTTTKSTDSE